MASRKAVPSYRYHKKNKQAIVTLTDGLGGRKDMLLGEYNSPASIAEYARVIGEWEASGRRIPGQKASKDITVNEVILAYLRHAETYYVKEGEPTTQIVRIKAALKIVRELYGRTRAEDFGPVALKSVRERMLSLPCGRCQGTGKRQRNLRRVAEAPTPIICSLCEGKKVHGWNRRYTNQCIGCIKGAFKWASSEELISPTVYHGLLCVAGLRQGRSKAREPVDVRPVADAIVEATLPHANPVVRVMIQVQRLTGARPGELCLMRGCDMDRTQTVWAFRPHRHKTQHHNRRRVIFIGPKAQVLLKPLLDGRAEDAYLFSPREATAARRVAQRQERKSRVQPSQRTRAKQTPQRTPGECYTTGSYRQAIERACIKAGVEPWHPHQLRHTAATEIRKAGDLDAARAVLGQASMSVAEVYAELDEKKASAIIGQVG